MGVLIIILTCLVPGWIAFLTTRSFLREKVHFVWWVAFSVFAIGGLVVGNWAGFILEYHVSPKVRFAGFPFPVAIFQLENDVWIDYVHGRFIMIAIGAADALVITLCSVLPISATYYAGRLQLRLRGSS